MTQPPEISDAIKLAIFHLEHMAAWIGKQNAGYSFESLGEDMPAIQAALAHSDAQSEAVAKEDWVKCPICDEPDMRMTFDDEDYSLIECTNHGCASNSLSTPPAQDHSSDARNMVDVTQASLCSTDERQATAAQGDLVDELGGGKLSKPPDGYEPEPEDPAELEEVKARLLKELQEHQEVERIVREVGCKTTLEALTALRAGQGELRKSVIEECAQVCDKAGIEAEAKLIGTTGGLKSRRNFAAALEASKAISKAIRALANQESKP